MIHIQIHISIKNSARITSFCTKTKKIPHTPFIFDFDGDDNDIIQVTKFTFVVIICTRGERNSRVFVLFPCVLSLCRVLVSSPCVLSLCIVFVSCPCVLSWCLDLASYRDFTSFVSCLCVLSLCLVLVYGPCVLSLYLLLVSCLCVLSKCFCLRVLSLCIVFALCTRMDGDNNANRPAGKCAVGDAAPFHLGVPPPPRGDEVHPALPDPLTVAELEQKKKRRKSVLRTPLTFHDNVFGTRE
jgi:hypothetical protein